MNDLKKTAILLILLGGIPSIAFFSALHNLDKRKKKELKAGMLYTKYQAPIPVDTVLSIGEKHCSIKSKRLTIHHYGEYHLIEPVKDTIK